MTAYIEGIVIAAHVLADHHPDNRYQAPPRAENDILRDSAPHCKYAAGECTNGSCGCIMGQAMQLCGVALEELQLFDAKSAGISGVVQRYQYPSRLSPSQRVFACEWLSLVQSSQDEGFRWSDAVARANNMYPGTLQVCLLSIAKAPAEDSSLIGEPSA